MNKKILVLSGFLAILLNGCNTEYSVHTNLDPQNIKDYFEISKVSEMDKESIYKVRNKSLGLVVGRACQLNEDDYIAKESDAKLDARQKALDLGANAIVYDKCIVLEKTPSCLKSVTCYSEAFIVEK